MHLQKFANAATTIFAKRSLLQEQISFLHRFNDQAKARRTTKSLVVGKAKPLLLE